MDNINELSNEIYNTIKNAESTELKKMVDDASSLLGPFGYLFKAYNGVLTIRDHFFIKKLRKFLEELSDISENDRSKMINDLEDEKYNASVGEKILILLDRSDGYEKVTMIGKIFSAYIQGKVDKSDLWGICNLINNNDISNIYKVCDSDKYSDFSQDDLIHTGLVYTYLDTYRPNGEEPIEKHRLEFERSAYALKISEIVFNKKKKNPFSF